MSLFPWQNADAHPRPASATLQKACSFRHPLCVHAAKDASGATLLEVLADAERAWDTATGALALPPPFPSLSTRSYDVYLVDGSPHGIRDDLTLEGERDPLGRFDRASAFSLVDLRLSGCARTQAVTRALLRAITFRTTPGIDTSSADAQTSYLAQLIAPCTTTEAAARGTFQAHPERAIADAWPEWSPEIGTEYGRGASLFYQWIDDSFGREPGSIVRALWALSPNITEPGATRWQNRPDGFDVLRITFKNALHSGSTVDDLFLGFGASRATFSASPVRADWQIDWPAKPRRLAPREPLSPTGSAYLLIRREGAPKGARLRIEATWEEHAKMLWAVSKLDAQGREMARVPIGSNERATEAQGSIVDIDGAHSLLVVGMNAGDFAVPFDPDDAVWEPHGFRVTVGAE